ncbi:MAG TPA: alpha/beta hydrolase [Candidatus Binataceae bacterium]|nr:alpha/beta hydrolase [Candidatus Binataceae bacterium]
MRVQVGDIKMFFDVEGAKLRPDGAVMREVPTLLLLHGGPGGDHSSFKPGYGALADIAQVIYLDHRGQGRSDAGAPEDWRLARWGDDVVAFCDALEIEKPIVLGLSFGGFVAAAYATRHPEHPGKLILCSTRAGRPDPAREAAVFERLGGKAAGDAARGFLCSESPTHDQFREFVRHCRSLYTRAPYDADIDARQLWKFEVMRSFRANEDYNFDYLEDLARIQCPTLVLAGEDDPITPPFYSEQMAAKLPAHLVRFERFANAGHGIAADAPERYFNALREFIAS